MALYRWEGGISKTTYPKFQAEMLPKGHVEEVMVINKSYAQISIKKEFLSDPLHENKINKSFAGGLNNGPHYIFQIPNNESFSDSLQVWQHNYGINYDYTTEDNWGR